MFKRLLILAIGLAMAAVTLTGVCYAQDEEITITTYYPSPYGVYNTLRLEPTDEVQSGGSCENAGDMRYSSVNDAVLYCNGGNMEWAAIGRGIGIGDTEVVSETKQVGDQGCSEHWCKITVKCPKDIPNLLSCVGFQADCQEENCAYHGIQYNISDDTGKRDKCIGYFDPGEQQPGQWSTQTVEAYCFK